MALIDHNNEETLPLVLRSDCWAAHSIYPHTKMDEARMVALVRRYGPARILVNSAADWGISDPLKVPKTVATMRAAGIAEADIARIFWDNPVAFFGQSGRLELPAEKPATEPLYQGNSILRGQAAAR
jgi:predicted metal-dependent TIM-barrel fold hydrolase